MIVVQVEVPGRLRAVSCRTESWDHELGDPVLAEFEGRTRFGTISRVPLELPWRDDVPLGRIVREADLEDEDQESHRDRRAEACLRIAEEKAAALGLEMRFVRAEPGAGGKRVTLLFTADGRVDFRELVRQLARDLRARIELRQIGVRDAAGIKGGLGHCGRDLCCSTWLQGFAPVSMRMAKQQGLPLNPAKISGQCGRLMCCLRYEIDDDGKRAPDTRLPSGNGSGGGNGQGCGGCGCGH